jgi:hypothetical protein
MPDPNKPIGVDYYSKDTEFVGGIEVPGVPKMVDWQSHADLGVQFAFLKSMQGHWQYNAWFNANYQAAKDAGLLRAPYLFAHPCEVQVPGNNPAAVTSANVLTLPLAVNVLDYALQQANRFCDQILAQGWGEPGDLPPMVDIERAAYWTANDIKVDSVVVVNATGQPVFVDPNNNRIGVIRVVAGNQVVFDAAGNQIGQVVVNAAGVAVGVNTVGGVRPGRVQRQDTDLWKRLPLADRRNFVVVVLVQIENRLGVKPIVYTGNTWREDLLSPTDNGGLGFTVNHNGVPFHIDHFGDYQPWFAQYPQPTPVGVTSLDSFPVTWAPRPGHDALLIWQYAGDPDRNVLVRITQTVPAPANPHVVTATVQELADLSPLERLANIVPPVPPAKRTLIRISPPPLDSSPERSFNLLLIGQGFRAEEFPAIAQRFWSDPAGLVSLTDTAPFGALRNPSRIACYADDGTGVFLRMRQTKPTVANVDDLLAIPLDATNRLRNYLPLLKIVATDGRETTADKVWLSQRRQSGATGALIAILRNGRNPARVAPGAAGPPAHPEQRPAELYQLDPSENYTVPVVAVNITWDDELWPLPVVRALAQNLAALEDEYELPGDAFDHPADGQAVGPTPNLIFLDEADRNKLPAAAVAGPVPADIAARAIAEWRLPANWALDFYSNGAPPGAIVGVHLVEGGGGFRHRVLRSDFDCLMRRIPSAVAAMIPNPAPQRIRGTVRFCRVCREWLEGVLRGNRTVRLGAGVRLDTQRIGYDWVNWKVQEQPAAGFDPGHAFQRVYSMAVPADEPAWSMNVSYNPAAATIADLFQITDVKLSQRPGDPYTRSVDIVRSLRFSAVPADLSVTFNRKELPTGPVIPESVGLNVADALHNSLDPPRLELASDGGTDRSYQIGARLTLSWPIVRQWRPTARDPLRDIHLFTVEAVLGLVLTGEQLVDPSFPVKGCKLLPQFAMRIRRSAGLKATGGSLIELKGSAVIEAINAIAPDATLDPALAPLATGRLGASVVCESNGSMWDDQFAPLASGVLLPASGRKRAGVHNVDALRWLAFVAPFEWSWRYDYVRSLLGAATTFAGVFRDSEPKGNANAVRTASFVWPAGSAFQLNVRKLPRQGTYDVLYIHPVDATAAPVLGFPAGGDLGLRLSFRRGLGNGIISYDDSMLLGWGTGRLDQGANTSLGAPLIPPNQHVDVSVEKVGDGLVRLTYTAAAQPMGADEWQVFLEQGLALGYRYYIDQLGLNLLVRFATLAGTPAATLQSLKTAFADTAHPARLDVQVRSLLRALHTSARFYDQQLDGTNVQQVPEAGAAPGVEAL